MPSEHQRKNSGLKPFKPGQSGNPGGRPKGTSLTGLLNAQLEKVCPEDKAGRTWKELVVQAWLREAIKGNVPALREMLERVEGKVAQELTGAGGVPLSIKVIYE